MHGPDGKEYPNQYEFREIAPKALVRLRHATPSRFELTAILT
jgi:hypothetical protein